MRTIAINSMFLAFLLDVSTAHGPGQGGPWEGAAERAKLKEDLEASIEASVPEEFRANDHALCLYVDATEGCKSYVVREKCFNLCKPKTVAGWCGKGDNWFVIGSQCFFRIEYEAPSSSAAVQCGNSAQGYNILAQPKDIKALNDILVDNGFGYSDLTPWSYWLGGSDSKFEGDWRWNNGSAITAVVNQQWTRANPDDYDCLTMRPKQNQGENFSLYHWDCNLLEVAAICEHHFHYMSYIQGGYLHAV